MARGSSGARRRWTIVHANLRGRGNPRRARYVQEHYSGTEVKVFDNMTVNVSNCIPRSITFYARDGSFRVARFSDVDDELVFNTRTSRVNGQIQFL